MNPAQPVVPVRQVVPSIRAASVLHLALGCPDPGGLGPRRVAVVAMTQRWSP
jgi:hypothetical protein